MPTDLISIVRLVTEGGALVLLVLFGYALYRLSRDALPSAKEFLLSLLATQQAMTAKLGVIETKVEGAVKSIERVEAAAAAGVVELREEVQRVEQSVLAAVRREQLPDRPSPSSAGRTRGRLTPLPGSLPPVPAASGGRP